MGPGWPEENENHLEDMLDSSRMTKSRMETRQTRNGRNKTKILMRGKDQHGHGRGIDRLATVVHPPRLFRLRLESPLVLMDIWAFQPTAFEIFFFGGGGGSLETRVHDLFGNVWQLLVVWAVGRVAEPPAKFAGAWAA